MKCSKCSFSNPPDTRYCMKCGALLIPPIPKENSRKVRHDRIAPFLIIIICLIGAALMLTALFTAGVVMSTIARSGSSVSVETSEQAYNPYEYPIFSSENDEKWYRKFINADAGTLTLPDTQIVITLPDVNDFHFSYDETRQTLSLELDTVDGTTVSLSSTKMDTVPYTRSEAEEYEHSGLFQSVEGSEDQYYYVLSQTGRTATANIIDRKSSRTTSIVVYDQDVDYDSDPDDSLAAKQLDEILSSTDLSSETR